MSERKRTRPTYGREFKAQAIAKCLEIRIANASLELGVSQAALRIWRDKAEENSQSQPGKPRYEDLEKENRRLKRKLGYVNVVNEILKKSTAIFSSSQMGGSR